MIITTSDQIFGENIKETLGLVKGSTIRAKHIGKDILASFRNIVGGEIKEYTEMFSEAREIALKRMVDKAKEIDADAVINIRFMTAMVMNGAAEIMVYGTAVKIKDQ